MTDDGPRSSVIRRCKGFLCRSPKFISTRTRQPKSRATRRVRIHPRLAKRKAESSGSMSARRPKTISRGSRARTIFIRSRLKTAAISTSAPKSKRITAICSFRSRRPRAKMANLTPQEMEAFLGTDYLITVHREPLPAIDRCANIGRQTRGADFSALPHRGSHGGCVLPDARRNGRRD